MTGWLLMDRGWHDRVTIDGPGMTWQGDYWWTGGGWSPCWLQHQYYCHLKHGWRGKQTAPCVPRSVCSIQQTQLSSRGGGQTQLSSESGRESHRGALHLWPSGLSDGSVDCAVTCFMVLKDLKNNNYYYFSKKVSGYCSGGEIWFLHWTICAIAVQHELAWKGID